MDKKITRATITLTLGQLAHEYGVPIHDTPRGDLAECADALVTLRRGDDGWHVSSDDPELELLDSEWAPQSDEQADEIRRARAACSRDATITTAQIRQLRAEAGEAGDLDQVAICDRALEGDTEARAECAEVIADARAMESR